MEFLHPFLRRNLAGKPVVASRNVDCLLRLWFTQFGGGSHSPSLNLHLFPSTYVIDSRLPQ